MCGEGHIPLACTADPSSAAPITGSLQLGQAARGRRAGRGVLASRWRCARLEDPPAPDQAVQRRRSGRRILACGDQVERALVRAATCASPWAASRPSSRSTTSTATEWNTAALGPTKRPVADELLRRLQRALRARRPAAPRPGQVVPGRAAAALGLSPATSARTASRSGATPRCIADGGKGRAGGATARRSAFGEALAARLGVDASLPHARLRGRLLLPVARAAPARSTSIRSTPSSRTSRSARACAACSSRACDQSVGLRAAAGGRVRSGRRRSVRLASGRWFLRDERMYLLPGDSPMGFRLPLDSLPWAAPGRHAAADSSAIRSRPRAAAAAARSAASPTPAHGRRRRSAASRRCRARRARASRPPSVVRTALCVEPRDGIAARVHAAR